MEKAFTELLSKAPELLITLGVVYLIVYLLREYRKIRQETEQSVRDVVNAKLGEYMSNIQTEISRVELISRDQEAKLKQLNDKYEGFTADLDSKTKAINGLYSEAQEKLDALREAIPNAEEFSARDLLGIAQRKENPQARAEICKRILDHQDSTSIELELAGDLMREANRYRLAMQLYEKAHLMDPERVSAQIEMLSLQAKVDFKIRDNALQEAKKVILKTPGYNGFARIANALIDLERHQELIDFSRAFIEVIGNRSQKLKALAFRNLGVAYKGVGDIAASLEAYDQAFSILPGDENILKPYLALLEEQGRTQEYNEIARKLIDIDPSDINYYRIYIDSLIESRNFSEAGIWLAKAKSLPKTQLDEARLESFEVKIKAAANNSPRAGEPEAQPIIPPDLAHKAAQGR